MTRKCTVQSVRRKREFDKDELSEIGKRRQDMEFLMQRVENLPVSRFKRNIRRAMIDTRRRFLESRYTQLTKLLPHQNRRVTDYLATLFGQKQRRLGLDPSNEYTLAGEVRHSLLDIQQTVDGMIGLLGRIQSLKYINEFVKGFDRIARKYKIPRETYLRLLDDSLTVGQIPRRMSVVQELRSMSAVQSPSAIFQRRIYDRYVTSMRNAGFTSTEIDTIVNLGYGVTQAFDEIMVTAQATGVNINPMENLGYITRVATRDFQLRLNDISPDELLTDIQNGDASLSSVYARSRSTWHFIPEDVAFTAKILGVSAREIEVLLESPLTWRKYLQDNVTLEQLETLVDSGVLTKLPMSSTEVFEYFVNEFQLPMSSISQMWKTDPYAAIDAYSRSLMSAASNSAMVRALIDNRAIEAGWAITEAQYFADPATYRNFVTLGSYLDNWASKANIEVSDAIRRMGLASTLEEGQQFYAKFSSMRVHPIVAAQWSAIMDLGMSPSMMGQAGQFFYRLNRILNKTVLGAENIQFIVRTALSGMITGLAGGLDLMYVPLAFDYVNRALTEGLDFLDNERVFRVNDGKPATLREFVAEFFVKRGQAVVPSVTRTRVSGGGRQYWSVLGNQILSAPQATAQALHDIWTYTMATNAQVGGRDIPAFERVQRLGRISVNKLDNAIDNLFEPVAIASNIVDLTFKLATFMSVTQTENVRFSARARQFAASQQFTNFKTFDEAYRHIDSYFVNVYDAGSITTGLASFVMPFAVWRMANPPMMLRHMLRHPVLFLNYNRLMSLTQQDEFERQPEGVYPSWILEQYPAVVYRDNEDRPYLLMPSNYDPINDFMVFTRETGNAILRWSGRPAGTQEQIRKQARGEVDDFAISIFSQTFPYIRGTVEQAFGVDTMTGRPFSDDELGKRSSFLGIPMTARQIALMRLVPGLNQLDELNLGGGSPTRRDAYGQIIERGTPSWSGAERTRIDTADYPVAVRMLRALGLNVRRIDYAQGLQTTLNDIENTVTIIESSVNENTTELRKEIIEGSTVDPNEFNRRVRAIREATIRWGQLKFDYLRVRQYMANNGLVPESVLEEMWRRRLTVANLPHPAQREIDSIVEQALSWDRELREVEKLYGGN